MAIKLGQNDLNLSQEKAIYLGNQLIKDGQEAGIEWQPLYPRNLYTKFSDIAYGNGIFVIIGYDTPEDLRWVVSEDGINWEDGRTGFSVANVNTPSSSIVFANGKFIVHNQKSLFLYESEDGKHWEKIPNVLIPENHLGYSMIYQNNNFFFCTTNNNPKPFVLSGDFSNQTIIDKQISDVAFDAQSGSYFLADHTVGKIYKTSNFVAYEEISVPDNISCQRIYINKEKIFVTNYKSDLPLIIYSNDSGNTWREIGVSAGKLIIGSYKDKFFAFSQTSIATDFLFSSSGRKWISKKLPMKGYFSDFAFNDEKIIAISNQKKELIYSSFDSSK